MKLKALLAITATIGTVLMVSDGIYDSEPYSVSIQSSYLNDEEFDPICPDDDPNCIGTQVTAHSLS